tara:strand:- start:1292 stop:1507 length:216 start_codon:yes stop_codon:yes gene_type:complete
MKVTVPINDDIRIEGGEVSQLPNSIVVETNLPETNLATPTKKISDSPLPDVAITDNQEDETLENIQSNQGL